MNDLRGPNIQIVLQVKEGIGFGFLSSPFYVSGSLNGYTLETDPVPPSHSPRFDSELAWEADKKRFRNLRFQNVPVKVEVHTIEKGGKKNKVGYLLLNLLSAQPCPSNRIANVKHTWHRLLGVKLEAKCCHPQLLLSLTIEDWINTPTPRNYLPVMHNNEAATLPNAANPPVCPLSLTITEYIAESKKTVTSPDLIPQLNPEEGLINIGNSKNKHLFILTLVMGTMENVDLVIPQSTESKDCYIAYSVFTHAIQTDRYLTRTDAKIKKVIQLNHRTSLRLCTDLASLSKYFAECRHVVAKLRCGDTDVGICCTDLRKLVPTEDVDAFVTWFCNADKALAIGERCFILPCVDIQRDPSRKPFVDIQISLSYVGKYKEKITKLAEPLTTRSESNLGSRMEDNDTMKIENNLDRRKSVSCTHVNEEISQSRLKDQQILEGQTEIAEMIRKMYESLATTKGTIASSNKPSTANEFVQCDVLTDDIHVNHQNHGDPPGLLHIKEKIINVQVKKGYVPSQSVLLSSEEKEKLMKLCVEELEDWKEKQKQLFKYELKQKEEYHLKMLSDEWNKRKQELETKLVAGIEMCRNLADELNKAGEDLTIRIHNVTQREHKVLQAKESLEQHYQKQYRDLREASQRMEDETRHEMRLKEMALQEVRAENERLREQLQAVKVQKERKK